MFKLADADTVDFWDNFCAYTSFMRAHLGVRNLEFQPRPRSGLYAQSLPDPEKATIRTRCDTAITPVILGNHHWQIEELVFSQKVLKTVNSAALVDVGANIGLFTRQVLGWCPSVKQSFAYEPEPENFSCFEHNLRYFKNVVATMAGLGEYDGIFKLYIDLQNCGNNSLVSDELAGAKDKSEVNVNVISAATECKKWQDTGLPIFYKSDTQGYDEKIITLLPIDFWGQVIGGVIEIENIDKPDFPVDKFVAFLDSYEKKTILTSSDHIVSTAEVMGYLARRGGDGVDLGFWR